MAKDEEQKEKLATNQFFRSLLENALSRFKRKVQSEDIIKEVKRHSYYLKPGEKRRVKSALARKRARKKIRREGSSRTDARRENK
jgi:small subunit ribosomal protein S21